MCSPCAGPCPAALGTYVCEQDGGGQQERRQPDAQADLSGLGQRAQVLDAHGVDDGVVPANKHKHASERAGRHGAVGSVKWVAPN